MTSDPPSAGHSQPAEPPPESTDQAAIVRSRGAPLLDALELHLPGAREHAEATGSWAFAAAVGLGMARAGAEACREAAKLHEIGKLYAPEEHHEPGSKLARGAGIPDEVCDWLLRARERFDGTGPDGLAGAAIPAQARIVRAACECDTVLSAPGAGDAGERRRNAAATLRDGAGAAFDPEVVAALVAMLERSSP